MTHAPSKVRAGRTRGRRAAGFTLIEVLIVVFIVAILASLVVPSLANAAAPLPRTVGDLLEADFRRARIESITAVRDIQAVVAADRDRWWLQATGPLDPRSALPNSLRILGSGNLAPFAGVRLEPKVDGTAVPRGATAFALFSPEGLRSASALEISLVTGTEPVELMRWTVAPQRAQLVERTADEKSDSSPAN